ncbi:MAG: oligosaccharide flippase family protein [Elusimicrobia bacterium]|nr:oligosaccharide flippase family protein [Elusimicrobiota bacterium]
MRAELRLLGRESLVYGLSTVVGRFLNFLLLPFYTHWLTTGEYGIVATVFAYLAFFNIFYQYGMDQAYLRFAAASSPDERARGFSTAQGALALTSLAFSGLLFIFAPQAAASCGLPSSLGDVPRLCAGILACDALAVIPFMELRRAHRSGRYVAIRTAGIALNVALNVFFLWHRRMGVPGVFLASLLSSAATLFLLAPILLQLWRPLFRKDIFLQFLRFSAPLVPSGLASMAVQVIDRPILKALTDDATVGIYQANYRLGIFMMLVVNMFDAAWRPFFMERAGRPESRKLFGRVLTYFMLGGSWIVLGLSLFIGDLARVRVLGGSIIHPDFWPGLSIVPVVLLAYLFNGAYVNFMVQATWTKRTDLLIFATTLGAVVNIAANILLIPACGMMGAALATLFAYAAMAFCLFWTGQKLYTIPYEYARLARLALVFTTIGTGTWALRRLELGPAPWIGVKAAALAAYPAILWLSGFFNEEERRALKSLL